MSNDKLPPGAKTIGPEIFDTISRLIFEFEAMTHVPLPDPTGKVFLFLPHYVQMFLVDYDREHVARYGVTEGGAFLKFRGIEIKDCPNDSIVLCHKDWMLYPIGKSLRMEIPLP